MFKGIAGAAVLGILDYLYIFVVLAVLALVMVILAKIVKYSSKNAAKPEKSVQPEQTDRKETYKKIESSQQFDIKKTRKDHLREKAVISAAIAVYLSEFKGATDYRIIDIQPAFTRQITPWGLSRERFPSVNLKK